MREDQSGIWSNLFTLLDSIPEDSIAITVYVLGVLIILWCWYGIAKRLPSPIGGITWVIVFAVIATPTISEGPNSAIAPAIFGLLFGVLTKDSPLVLANCALIAFVMGLGLIVGYFWLKYKNNPNRVHHQTPKKTALAKNISPL